MATAKELAVSIADEGSARPKVSTLGAEDVSGRKFYNARQPERRRGFGAAGLIHGRAAKWRVSRGEAVAQRGPAGFDLSEVQ